MPASSRRHSVSVSARLRTGARAAVAVGTVAATALLSVPAAHANDNTARSRTSPKGGYGVTTFYNTSILLDVCDRGNPDGLRTVGYFLSNGVRREVHAASGTGTCALLYNFGVTQGASYTIWTCLRNGASGADVYCGSRVYGTID